MISVSFIVMGLLFTLSPAWWIQNKFGENFEDFLFNCSHDQLLWIRAMVLGGISLVFFGFGMLYSP